MQEGGFIFWACRAGGMEVGIGVGIGFLCGVSGNMGFDEAMLVK